MESPRSVEDLEIVGYANVFRETMLPTVAPPVYRLRADAQRALLPPYSLNAGFLCNATEVPQAELEELRDSREITLFDHAFPAIRDFELWIDQSFQIHYEPLDVAKKNLALIADDAIVNAEKALRNGDLRQAEHLSGVAISADGRRASPLVIKAAIRRLQNNKAGERLMAEVAAPALTENEFTALVDQYCAPCQHTAPTAQPTPRRSMMHNVACLRTAA
jgi:hypothetical protein